MSEINFALIQDRINSKFDKINSLMTLCRNHPDNTDYPKRLAAELASSIQATEDITELQQIPHYTYKNRDNGCAGGNCTFYIDGVEFAVADLREMRKDPSICTERYYDICVVVIDFMDDDGMMQYHILPHTYLHGSSTSEFNQNKPVHDAFVNAAKQFIKEHGGAERLRELQKYE